MMAENDKTMEDTSFPEEEQLEQALKRVLYRFDCPPIEELRDYYANDLEAEAHRRVTAHILHCVHCSAEVAELTAFMAPVGDPTVESIFERLYQGVCLVARQLTAQPGLVAVRGRQTVRPLLFEVGDITLSVSMQPQPTGYLVQGRIAGTASPPVGELFLWPRLGSQSLLQASLERGGKFKLAPVSAGRYQLILALDEQAIIIPELVVGAE